MTTGKGRERPELSDVDLSDLPATIVHPDSKEVERRHAFAAQLESPSFLARTANAGVVKVIRSDSQPATEKRTRNGPLVDAQRIERSPDSVSELGSTNLGSQPRKPRSEEPNLTVRLPEYVQQAVRMRAVVEKTTVRLVILRALRNAGFEVRDEDMTDDRGIVAKMRSIEGRKGPY